MIKKTILFAAVILLAACGTRRVAPDAGTFTDGTYRNDFFGLTVRVPDGVYVTTGDELAALRDAAGGEGDLLLLLSQRKVGVEDSTYNYTLSVVSERLERRSGIENGEQYAAKAIDALTASRGDIKAPTTRRESVGEREFIRFDVPLYDGVSQSIYTRVERDYAIVLTATYDSAAQTAGIDALLGAVQFDK